MAKYLLFLIFPIISHSQTLMGTVKDTLNNSLENANVIAKPLDTNNKIKFAIADHLGRYKLELQKDVSYEVRVSYLGFKEQVLKISANFSEKEHHFILKESGQELKEIIISYEYKPVIIKKDTLIYDVMVMNVN